MAGELLPPSKIKCRERSRHDDEGERNVREQHAVVEGAQPTLPAEGSHLRGTVVVDEIADEEGGGKKESTQHEVFVQSLTAVRDSYASQHQEEQGGSVE